MTIEHFVTLDLQSGTYFPAQYTYLLDTRRLSAQELDEAAAQFSDYGR